MTTELKIMTIKKGIYDAKNTKTVERLILMQRINDAADVLTERMKAKIKDEKEIIKELRESAQYLKLRIEKDKLMGDELDLDTPDVSPAILSIIDETER